MTLLCQGHNIDAALAGTGRIEAYILTTANYSRMQVARNVAVEISGLKFLRRIYVCDKTTCVAFNVGNIQFCHPEFIGICICNELSVGDEALVPVGVEMRLVNWFHLRKVVHVEKCVAVLSVNVTRGYNLVLRVPHVM